LTKPVELPQGTLEMLILKAVSLGPLHGYGTYTVGPVGSYPVTDYLSDTGKQGDPFPFSVDKAKALLVEHGWNVVPNGESTCSDPAKCGAGVKQGQGLSFNLPYRTGVPWIESMVEQLKSNASEIGIKLNLQPEEFAQVAGLAGGDCQVAKISCGWDMAIWGGGWSFSPDYYPSGETLFQGGSVANSSGFEDARNDELINETLTANSMDPMHQWQDYLAPKLPENWLPNAVYSITEVSNNLQGVLPQSSIGAINPENWYFTK